jgi:hypothetical protein
MIGRLSANIIQESIKLLKKTRIGIKIYNKTKNRFPLGYFVIAKKN